MGIVLRFIIIPRFYHLSINYLNYVSFLFNFYTLFANISHYLVIVSFMVNYINVKLYFGFFFVLFFLFTIKRSLIHQVTFISNSRKKKQKKKTSLKKCINKSRTCVCVCVFVLYILI